MAQRRMFSKTITNSGKFLKMPPTSRLLYYDLGMNADDDGYAEWFTVVRMSGSTEQDLKVLEANGFIHIFDENVLVILNWKENNYIQKDRYFASKYKDVYIMDTNRVHDGHKMDTQYRLGKDSTGKNRLGKENKLQHASKDAGETFVEKKTKVVKQPKVVTYNPLGADILKAFEAVDPKNKTYYGNKTQRASCDFLLKEYGLEKTLKIVSILPQINTKKLYVRQITTPYELQENWVKVMNAIKQQQEDIKSNIAFI